MVTEKACASCKATKPIERFALSRKRHGNAVLHPSGGECRSQTTTPNPPPNKHQHDDGPHWPVPAMGLVESLECVRFRKWGGAEPNARFGVPSIGAMT